MSRLVQPPFHRPSPFFPPSPPETNSEFITPARVAMPVPIHTPQDVQESPDASFHSMNFDPYHSRPKKSSSLSYNTSGIRESRERTIQRSLKSFIIVLPPPSLLEEHGQLGATLSSGPIHRLSQGVLMPLFPTMHGQVTAIAREFNFPSTAGICLYLHYTDGGMTITPRIGDESWSFLWAQAFDANRVTGFPPISGRVEFDIDLRQARWYPAWVSAQDRVTPASPPRRAPSRLHRHSDSKTAYDDDPDDTSVHNSLTVTRHIPKKLSLVDRFDSASSVRSLPRAQSHSLSPPAQIGAHSLSPIPQATEPPSAKVELEKRVNNWRASASLKPTPLATTSGQTSLEPANLPNTLELDALLDDNDARSELNLDDFTWSISSAGPIDYLDGASIPPSDRAYSVHLANRAEGSVCLTPSECTSFGPSDYDMEYVAYPPSIRIPTPDLAMRMYDDCPPTPTTVTSWGAPLSYPPTPTSVSRPPSVDLATRYLHSRPVTPTTATSWGPPSWPSSPAMSEFRPPSIHMADRGETSLPVSPVERTAPWRYVWPYRSGENQGPSQWAHVWPYTLRRSEQQENGDGPWRYVWPYRTGSSEEGEEDGRSWQHVWPYVSSELSLENEGEGSAPWAHVWPYTLTAEKETVRTWRHVWPYSKAVESQAVEQVVPSATTYPVFNLYPAVYPNFNLYPSPVRVEEPVQPKAMSTTSYSYPTFNLYPAVYPHFNLYPTVHAVERSVELALPKETEKEAVVIKLAATYPAFDLYPSVYPYNLERIYTFSSVRVDCHEISTRTVSRYPFFELYAPVYPCIRPYVPLSGFVEVEAITQSKTKLGSVKSEISVALPSVYPHFNLYPSVYPYNLDRIYPATSGQSEDIKEVIVGVVSAYPTFVLYPSVYPHNLNRIYAPISGQCTDTRQVTVSIVSGYPYFILYPKVYPHNLDRIYAPVAGQCEDTKQVIVDIVSGYPNFVLYASIYPYNLDYIYPRNSGECEVAREVVIDVVSSYPNFVLYPSVYPYNLERIYPSVTVAVDYTTVSMKVMHRYPVFQLYAPVYPHIIPYPQVSGEAEPPVAKEVVQTHSPLKITRRKSHLELHISIFGDGPVSTPSGTIIRPPAPSKAARRKTHAELHFSVFGDGLVNTPSGTIVPRPIRPRVELAEHTAFALRTNRTSPVGAPRRALPGAPHDSRAASPAASPVRTLPPRTTRPSLPLPPPPPQPSPTRRLPTPPTPPVSNRTPSRRMSITEVDLSDLPPARPRGLPPTPQQLPRPQSTFETSPATSGSRVARRTSSLEHLGRSQSLTIRPLPREGMQRSQTMMLPISPVREQVGDEVFEMVNGYSQPRAMAPPPMRTNMGHKRRDSLVQQRVKALNSIGDETNMTQTLGEFPEPPKKAPVVSRLDRTKYTAFS